MESWQKDLYQFLEAVASEAEQFFEEVNQVVAEVATEIDQVIDKAIEPVVDFFLEMEAVFGEATQPVVQTMQPILEEHPACVGCHHYHGQVHGGNLLICAMHPYGWDSDACPDWQSAWEARQ
ncbi:MAG TPA: hypothetical protein V6D03_04060 [Candidatus Caenarcaniphilales bacterium]